ncbi:MAG: hypothetical protein JWL76_2128 [Thermoleophilia bacterium]|nr:hypothetical protein [Thermoleophilia bacterium]
MARRADIQRVVDEYRRRLSALEAEYARSVGPAHAEAARRIRDELGRFLKAVEAEGIPERVTRAWVTDHAAYRRLALVAEHELDGALAQAVRAIQWRIADAAQLGKPGADAMTAAVIGPQGNGLAASGAFGQVNIGAMEQLVGALQASSPLAKLPGLTSDVVDKMTSELVRGLANGTHSRTIARQIAKTTGMPAVRARTIARTEIHRAYREGNRAAYQVNPAVDQWRWVASISARTCSACLSMHGSLHPLDEPLQSHPQCRCAMAPIVGAKRLRDLGIEDPGIEWPTGEQLFAQMPEADQLQVLGPGKFEAYRDGRIQLRDTVRTTHTREWGATRTTASLDDALTSAAG